MSDQLKRVYNVELTVNCVGLEMYENEKSGGIVHRCGWLSAIWLEKLIVYVRFNRNHTHIIRNYAFFVFAALRVFAL